MCLTPHSAVPFALLLLAEFLVSWSLVILLRRWLIKRDVMDIPNDRSSHDVPVPRGGGLVIVAVSLTLWIFNYFTCAASTAVTAPMLAAVIMLAAVSWWDDHRNLSFKLRLLVQGLAVVVALWPLPDDLQIFPWLPLGADRLLLLVAALWFINLFNFMDGINGALGAHILGIAAGILLVAPRPDNAMLTIYLLPATLGFLMLNWGRAKIFAGDIGSITIGFMLGWQLLQLALAGLVVPAFIIILYPFADATLTLLRRAVAREKLWQPHCSHFYQQAVQSGLSHARVAAIMLAVNVAMAACALFAKALPMPALIIAIITVSGVLFYFQRRYQRQVPATSFLN